MSPDAFKTVKDATLMREMEPYVRSQVEGMEKALINRVMSDLNKGELTPEKAQLAWVEFATYRKLLSGWQQKGRIGVSVGQQHKAELDKIPMNTHNIRNGGING